MRETKGTLSKKITQGKGETWTSRQIVHLPFPPHPSSHPSHPVRRSRRHIANYYPTPLSVSYYYPTLPPPNIPLSVPILLTPITLPLGDVQTPPSSRPISMYFDPKNSQKSLLESGPAWVAFMILQNREKFPTMGSRFQKN